LGAHAEKKCFYLLYFPGVKISYEFEFVTKQTPVLGIRPVETIEKNVMHYYCMEMRAGGSHSHHLLEHVVEDQCSVTVLGI